MKATGHRGSRRALVATASALVAAAAMLVLARPASADPSTPATTPPSKPAPKAGEPAPAANSTSSKPETPDKPAPVPKTEKKDDAEKQPTPEKTPERKVKLNDIIDKVVIKEAGAKEAFEWWANTTGVKLLINWTAMEKDGVDPSQHVNLDLTELPSGQALALIMRQASPEQDLVYEATPWYVEVMTKKQANLRPVLKTYPVGDLVHVPPPVNVNTSAGGLGSTSRVSSSSSSRSTTSVSTSVTSTADGTINERDAGEALVKVITETIEPELWTSNGGSVATIRYARGMLLVKAPLYVHAQIALTKDDREYRVVKPEPATESRAVKSDGASTSDTGPAGKTLEKSPEKAAEKPAPQKKPTTP